MIPVLFILITLLDFGRSQLSNSFECSNGNGNYTSNSPYGANLNALVNSLSTNINNYGFYASSLSTAYALSICRGDRTLDQCRVCVAAASLQILQRCPNQREAVLWDEFCLVRYSNNPILGNLTTDPYIMFCNTGDASNEDYNYREEVTRLVLDLQSEASEQGSELKFGVGSRIINGSRSQIYGLAQCTPDLSTRDCRSCLVNLSERLFTSCDLSGGIRLFVPSCHIRFDFFNFYNETRLRELQILPPLSPSPQPPGRSDGDNSKVVILITVPTCVISLILIASAVIIWRKKMNNTRKQGIIQTADEISSVESLQYDLEIIRAATSDFGEANKLGQGGFGAVYWGKFEDGQEIAAKRLSKDSGQGDIEFKNEVLLVARLQHRNLVKLLGFSLAGTERILVYEFVQKSSLDKFIFDPTRRSDLGWDTRYKIIGGLARGLLYLHEDSRLRIIHRDLKASNVLLDGDMNPKIADFGMARLFRQDEIQGNTNKIVGTYGYMSPEYAMHGEFSIKSDVFSYGVLILEIISGRRNNLIRRGKNVEDLLTLTWENWRGGTIVDMIDPVLRNCSAGSVGEMLRCTHIGLLCVQEKAGNRPTMTSVVSMFNSLTTAMFPQPLEPAFYNASSYGPNVALIEENDSKSSATLNDMSASELYPR